MAERNWGLWAVPGSSTVSSSVPSATIPATQRVPPKTPIKMSGTHRPPKIPAALRKRKGPPAQKMPGNYVSFKPPVEESEESSEEEISQDARHVFKIYKPKAGMISMYKRLLNTIERRDQAYASPASRRKGRSLC
jgi:hypothetical protein